jgi:hypothetical protein
VFVHGCGGGPGPPIGRVVAEASPPRVVEDVGHGAPEVLLVADHPGGESVAPQVSPPAVPLVEALGVDAVEALHPPRELRLGRLEDEVDVRSHQHEGVATPVEADDALGEE